MKFENDEIKKVFKGEAKNEVPDDGIKRHPMRLKCGYVTADPTREKDATGFPRKMLAGEVHYLPIEEARQLIKRGVAERADEIEL